MVRRESSVAPGACPRGRTGRIGSDGMRRALALALALTPVLLAGAPAPSPARTTWLCRPGQAPDPCTPGLSTTRLSATGTSLGTLAVRPSTPRRLDCFYVYPTVSEQPGILADLHVDPVERSIALYQAARYSQVCRVYAPMYRQVTLTTLDRTGAETPAQLATGLGDVRSAFREYLVRYNRGRPFVLIGHSQGAFVVRRLIASDVDPRPAVRRHLLSAIVLGGDVTVARGRDTGGDFRHVPACRRPSQTGCVIAYSTYDQPAPANSLFGRTSAPGLQVLCTNPAALAGGAAALDTIEPVAPFAPGSLIAAGIAILALPPVHASTVWAETPAAFTGRCDSAGGANVLEITPRNGAPLLHPSPDATWGLHLVDANIALGNLIDDVSSEAIAYRHGGS